jgi:hypothetical protein
VADVHAGDARVKVNVLVSVNIFDYAIIRRVNAKWVIPQIRGGDELFIFLNKLSSLGSRGGNNNFWIKHLEKTPKKRLVGTPY